MAIRNAVMRRRLQFSAGPQSHVFFVCEEHKQDLTGVRRWYANDLFYSTDAWAPEAVDPDDEIACDSCRGEEGP